uniref:magnesium chelatase n=1 Tax=Spongospora subterranea TaxID=70186 RepID=A0A0H5QXA6_9EUKA|eukprot:CRZ06356.1 hypothetical protein [Spongospora subterranea]
MQRRLNSEAPASPRRLGKEPHGLRWASHRRPSYGEPSPQQQSTESLANFWLSPPGSAILKQFSIPFVHALLSSLIGSQNHLLVRFPNNIKHDFRKPAPLLAETVRTVFYPCSYLKFSDKTNPEELITPQKNCLEGPIFSSLFICEDLHLAPNKTRALVLEAMRMKVICVKKGHRKDLAPDFTVIATYTDGAGFNPALSFCRDLRDRFTLELVLDVHHFKSVESSLNIPSPITKDFDRLFTNHVRLLRTVDTSHIYVSNSLQQYIRDIIICVRNHPDVGIGPSPKGSSAILHACRIRTLLFGFSYARPIDIDTVAPSCLCHRIDLRSEVAEDSRSILHGVILRLMPPR